jgi:hypothetical protein
MLEENEKIKLLIQLVVLLPPDIFIMNKNEKKIGPFYNKLRLIFKCFKCLISIMSLFIMIENIKNKEVSWIKYNYK